MLSLLLTTLIAFSLPPQPTEVEHPGSSQYQYQLFSEAFKFGGRDLHFYAPRELLESGQRLTLIVFGHGQATPVSGYNMTFEHLAKKGYAVLFPQYDSGFFDQNWVRMGSDFNALTLATIQRHSNSLSAERVVYSGHSKGGFVALVAAGLKSSFAKSLVLLSPAGFTEKEIKTIDVTVPVTLVWSEDDRIIKEELIQTIYKELPVSRKQMIRVLNYTELKADHFFPLNRKFVFGGANGVSPFHFYSVWPWLVGAARDVEEGTLQTNSYLYGEKALGTGIIGFSHQVDKSW